VKKHRISEENAPLISQWLEERGGILVWDSADLCDPGKSWTTPAHNADGTRTGKPSWQAQSEPARRIMLTDASGRKLRDALDKAGPQSWHEFDYFTQEAIIFKPGRVVPLEEWREA
jgi:hypothetical protein